MFCQKSTDRIILHSKNLVINEDEVVVALENSDDGSGEEKDCGIECTDYTTLKILNHCYHDDYEFYIITLTEKLKPGFKYSVLIPYQGEITQGLAGFYRSSYTDLKTGETRSVVQNDYRIHYK